MNPEARPAAWQLKLPLVDIPALATPRQQELSYALMTLLVQAARQIENLSHDTSQEGPHGCQADV